MQRYSSNEIRRVQYKMKEKKDLEKNFSQTLERWEANEYLRTARRGKRKRKRDAATAITSGIGRRHRRECILALWAMSLPPRTAWVPCFGQRDNEFPARKPRRKALMTKKTDTYHIVSTSRSYLDDIGAKIQYRSHSRVLKIIKQIWEGYFWSS